jgi:hypothetical protein
MINSNFSTVRHSAQVTYKDIVFGFNQIHFASISAQSYKNFSIFRNDC